MDKSEIIFGPIKDLLSNFLDAKSYSKIAILVDENTKELCLPLLPNIEYTLIETKSGESNKNLKTCATIWEALLLNKMDRQSLLINLGGGVISDMGGFCASCYKRGIAFINIPTTLLAMVDASIGAKTGIDFESQKNMIGLFSAPQKVLIDDTFLKTLEDRQILSGKAEMLKHGLIANAIHFEHVVNCKSVGLDLIKESIKIKAIIVEKDPFENGIRKSLNFGHTLGHALESFYLQQGKDILHGEAVAQGMIWAIQLSIKHAELDMPIGRTLISAIKDIYGEITIDKTTLLALIAIAKNDKKNKVSQINFCLLQNIGDVKIDISFSEIDILTTLSN